VFPQKKRPPLSTLQPPYVNVFEGRVSTGSHGTGHFVHGQCGTQYEWLAILSVYPNGPPLKGREGWKMGPGFVTWEVYVRREGGMGWWTRKGGEVLLRRICESLKIVGVFWLGSKYQKL